MSKKETIRSIIAKAMELSDNLDEAKERLEEELCKLRGCRLTKEQKEIISQMDAYMAYELTEDN